MTLPQMHQNDAPGRGRREGKPCDTDTPRDAIF